MKRKIPSLPSPFGELLRRLVSPTSLSDRLASDKWVDFAFFFTPLSFFPHLSTIEVSLLTAIASTFLPLSSHTIP